MRYSLALVAAIAAVNASPIAMPQGVTEKIAPSAPAPSGCMMDMTSTFGIAVMNVTGAAGAQVTESADGQAGAGTASAAVITTISDGQAQGGSAVPITTISDGQPQAPTATAAPVTQISDGQIQAGTSTVMAVTQISDGQIQAHTMTAISQIGDGQIQAPYATAVSQISDGQIQAPTGSAVSQISDGQIQAPTGTAVSQISDGQAQAPTGSGVKTAADGQATSASATNGSSIVACKGDSTLQMTLEGGVLTDDLGRTGYIASNFQFQFDDPPQAGSIYTSGWSVCENGSLALGGSEIFYQCLSGDFYNLYSENWANTCSPITITVLDLVDCE